MARVEQLAEGVTLILGDAREVVPTVTGVDLVVTSPPYDQQREYDAGGITDWRSLVSGVLTPTVENGSTQVLVNLGLVHRDGVVIPYWQGLLDDMTNAGWRHFGWYVWDQGPGMPGDWNGRLGPAHEWIFHFNHVARKPNKTVQSKYAGYVRSKPQGGIRRPDGTMSGWSHGVEPTQDLKIPDSVVRITRHKHTGGIEAGHPAVFPVAFAAELILAYSQPAELVMDPFCGSGSSGVAAVEWGRRFLGIELSPAYFDIACRRIEAALKQPSMFAAPPAPATQLTMLDAEDAA